MSTEMIRIATCLLLAGSAAAQDLIPKAAPQAGPIVLRGATVHTMSGATLDDADVLFDEGLIRAVQSGRVAAGEAQVIDARGKHVYPGFVCVASTLGLTEVGAVDMTIDMSEAGSMNPEVYAAVAVNPDSWLIPVARRNGVLTAGVMPQGGTVAGRVSVMRLDGWTWDDMAIEADAGLMVNWPFMGSGGGRFGRFRRGGGDDGGDRDPLQPLEELWAAAGAYLDARAADPSLPADLGLEAMGPTLAGETPLYVSATTLEQIQSAVTWTAGRGQRLVIVGGRDAGLCADLLKRHDVFVALTGTHRMPHRRDLSWATTYELPAELEAAGVRWCLTMSPRGAANVRNLPYEAAAAVAHGLSREAAIRSITLSAAECLGVADRLGSIEPGKAATLLVVDGDPLELSSRIERAYIDGREIELRDKQTELAAKYREKYRQLGLIEDAE